jgi:hypothetical protein
MEGRRRGLAGGESRARAREGGFGKEIRVSRGNLIFLAARVRVRVRVLVPVLVAWRGRWVDVLDPFPCFLPLLLLLPGSLLPVRPLY